MKTIIPAVYEDGVFRPTVSVSFPSGSHHRLVVEADQQAGATEEDVDARFPGLFAPFPRKDADQMLAIIEEAFGRVECDD